MSIYHSDSRPSYAHAGARAGSSPRHGTIEFAVQATVTIDHKPVKTRKIEILPLNFVVGVQIAEETYLAIQCTLKTIKSAVNKP
jgi:hypothetical protein